MQDRSRILAPAKCSPVNVRFFGVTKSAVEATSPRPSPRSPGDAAGLGTEGTPEAECVVEPVEIREIGRPALEVVGTRG
jgi:hypothetical protein